MRLNEAGLLPRPDLRCRMIGMSTVDQITTAEQLCVPGGFRRAVWRLTVHGL